MKTKLSITLRAIALALALCNATAQPSSEPDAEKAWKQLQEALKPPVPPVQWATKPPTPEQRAEFQKTLADRSAAAALQAREFYTAYPSHPKAAEAREKEKKMLEQAVNFGAGDKAKDLEALSTDSEKVALRLRDLHKRAMARQAEGAPAVFSELENGVRALLKEFPNEDQLWKQFLLIAQNSSSDRAKPLLKEVLASKASESVREKALTRLKQLDAIGFPFEMAFTALDGRAVDIQKMNGKVVLIDFWATWCGPCIAALPHVKEVYDKYHSQGFEIVGISLDKSRKSLETFLEQESIPWPQYFDGKGWATKWSAEFNIAAIPTMYLVDKKGILRDMSATEDFENKVRKLLAEK